MAEGLGENLKGFVEKHPYASAGLAAGTILIVWWLVASGSSSSTTPTQSTSDNTSADAAAVQAAQIAANSNIAAANIAAGVQNTQTAAAQTVALAQLQSQNDQAVAAATALGQQAQYNAAAEIAGSNAAVAIAATQAQQTEQLSNNNTLAGEYNTLAATLNSYYSGSGGTAVVDKYGQPVNPSYSAGVALASIEAPIAYATSSYVTGTQASTEAGGQQSAGGWGGLFGWLWPLFGWGGYGRTSTQSQNQESTSTSVQTSTPVVNPNLAAANAGFMQGFGALTAGLGVGLQAPQTQTLTGAQMLSLAQINAAAVNGGNLPGGAHP